MLAECETFVPLRRRMGLHYVVTGSEGQLGRCLVRGFSGAESTDRLLGAYSHAQLDIADRDAVGRVFGSFADGSPDILVNAAAYNQVDRCESDGADAAMRVNGEGPGILAAFCEDAGIRLIHVSTDYVFSGEGDYPVSEDAPPAPRTAYGRSKLEGEKRVRETSQAAMVVRTSWVFGPGKNFVGAILRQGRLRRTGDIEGPLRVVDDQRGCPTYAADLAQAIRTLAGCSAPGGIYHWQNAPDPSDPEAPTWWDFARAVLDGAGYADLQIDRAQTEEMAAPARRPAYSVLGCERAELCGAARRSWRDALAAYLASPDLEATLDMSA
jgi:dTDP-4-dehydrorhamnose reductase